MIEDSSVQHLGDTADDLMKKQPNEAEICPPIFNLTTAGIALGDPN